MKVAALLCARGGSKRIPRKNIAMCAGKKLIEWALIAANEAKCIDKLYVSTEDSEIAETGRMYGAEILDRPWQLATDTASDTAMIYQVFSEMIRVYDPDYVVRLAATSPCIQSYQIDDAMKILLTNNMAVQVFTVHKMVKPSQLNNYHFMLANGSLGKIFPEDIRGVNPYITNNLADLYYQNGAFSIDRLEKQFYNLAPNITEDMPATQVIDLYATYYARQELTRTQEGRNLKLGYVISEYDATDINYPEDLIIAESLLNYRKGKRNG